MQRKKYGLSDKDVVFIYSGRVMPEKGVLELVEAFMGNIESCPDAKLVIAGLIHPKEYECEIRKHAVDSQGRIIVLGWIPPYDMQNIYAVGDVVVAPTVTEEAFGMITLEAMAMEKPIVISDSGGMPEIVTDECGITAHRGENFIKELSAAMTYLYNNPETRVRMGKRGREIVMATYDFRKEFLHDRMMNLFDELDKRRGEMETQ